MVKSAKSKHATLNPSNFAPYPAARAVQQTLVTL
jgi:hypothetical protein